jgi:hypothetical protein
MGPLWRDLRDDASDWCVGRSWPPRALLLAFLAYTGVRHLADPEYASIFSGLTLAIHELGHVVFQVFGEWMMVAGGSLAQLAAPVAAAAVLKRQRDYFGVAVCGAWLSYSLCGLATYVADARAQELPLVGLSDDPEHDWHYLLGRAGMLSWDTRLAGLTRLAAFVTLAASLWLGVWLCVRMARAARARPTEA